MIVYGFHLAVCYGKVETYSIDLIMRYYSLIVCFFVSAVAFAQLSGNGYYRIQGLYAKRYLYLMDNRGEVDLSSAAADVEAIKPYLGDERMISDPASVFFFQSLADGWKLSAQGASTTNIIGENPLHIMEAQGGPTGTYWCYASNSGTTLYLADTETIRTEEEGIFQTISPQQDSDGKKTRNFFIKPVDATSDDNYFGVKPTFSCNGKYYASFYVSFPFSFASSGMKAYIVTKTSNNKAALKEISGVIPASTPILIECSSDSPAQNRLNFGGNASAVANVLSGNFFCYDPVPGKVSKHTNLTPFSDDMRVFGVTSTGKLGFIKPTETYIPANVAYLKATGADDELILMSEEEFDQPEYLLGDANGDGKVNVGDVNTVVNYIVGKTNEKFVFEAADIDANEKINVGDVNSLINIVLKK